MASPRHEVGPARRAAAPGDDSELLAAELARAFPGALDEGVLEPRELADRQGDVFRLALPVLEAFAGRPGAARALAFVDPAGGVLWVGGDAAVVSRLAALRFRPGTTWRGAPSAAEPPSAAAADRRGLELVVPDRSSAPAPWRCSSAPVVSRAGGGVLGTVHLTMRGDAGDPESAPAIAEAVAERLHLALAIREQVVEFALRAAAPGDAAFAVDASGRVLCATPGASRLLAPHGGELPERLRDELRSAVAAARPGDAPELALRERTPAATLVAVPVRCEQHAVGAVLRVVPAAGVAAEARTGARPAARYAFEQILGTSEAIGAAVALARTAARNELPVVLQGESGTGKELFAHAIHSASARAGGPFVAVNCGCIPGDLLEAELFGYEPGTFTGGRREGNTGKFEQAARGTLFLDEVTELPARAQTALLRVLQEREVVRLGGSSPRRIDVRVVAASNAALSDAVRAGRFRGDLYYRLNVLPIAIPALRERSRDVALLARAFLRQAEAEVGRAGLSFAAEAVAALEGHAWPGNVRELRNFVLRAAATAGGAVIGLADLPAELRAARPGAAVGLAPGERPETTLARGDAGAPDREALVAVLHSCAWNVARTAQALRISRMTLYRWLRKLHIER